jgi:hypothetical protein
MKNNFFLYLGITIVVITFLAFIAKIFLLKRSQKIRSKKSLESFLTIFSESYYRSKNIKNIKNDLTLQFNYLFCNMVKFPEKFEENYIDEESGKFVKEILPLLKELYYRQDTDTIASLQKKFFDKVEEKIAQEIIH